MIQIDMPMPKSCVECRFSQGGYMYCHAMPENYCGYVNYCEEDGRPEWCPLKAQEPRVMTLEEIPDAVFGWMEMFGQLIPCVLEDVYVDDTVGFANIEDGHDYICASDYNKTWRCWTQKPSDAQREAVKWE